jgi:hypothetical protein
MRYWARVCRQRWLSRGQRGPLVWLFAVAALGSIATAAAGTACRQLAGIHDDPPEKLTTSACGLAFGSSACAACASTNCCAQASACAADPSCESYASCHGDCNGDPMCQEQCLIDHPISSMDVSTLSACVASKCPTACNLRCGGFAGYTVEPDAAPACEACYAASGCSAATACAQSAVCDAVNRCGVACRTADCVTECARAGGVSPDYEVLPTAADAGVYEDFTNVHNGTCATACANGRDWRCLGHFGWSSPTSGGVEIRYVVKDFASGAVVPMANVSVCSFVDTDCSMPLANGTTSDAGVVSLSVSNVSSGGGVINSLGLNGYFKVLAPGYPPYYSYWGFPLSASYFGSYGEIDTMSSIQQNVGAVNAVLDPSRGILTVVVYDCVYNAAPDVEVTLSTADVETRSFRTSGLETATTDVGGLLIFLNVPVGDVLVTAKPAALDRTSSTVSATVRAGSLTSVGAVPTPQQ